MIGDRFAYAEQQQQQQLAADVQDPLADSLQIAQYIVKDALFPGLVGHGVPSLHNLSTQYL